MTTPMFYSTVEEFVKAHEGTNVIEKILVANNGISAVKAIRSIRRWAYDIFGRERAIKFVAMATPEDLKANAEYIRMADEFVEVPGGSNVNNYANVNLIISLAKRYNVNAVFAGWGHASENPALPDGLLAENIIFMGPPSGPMFALGDKIGSTIIAQSAGVPVIPWSGDGLKCDYKGTGMIPDEVYRAANVTTVEECRAAVQRVGLPVMIKASEGGGGKGIRKVMTEDQLDAAFRQVQTEVPGSPIFVMKVAFGARHLEVQLLADHYGNAIALNGRDCSIQRRHQKILEEGPPCAAPLDVWREMERAAVRLAKEVGYRNAGTVEYLFQEAEKTFCFLELNPRLQVEHPVTEMITGVNLPAAQLQVAMGIPLYRNKDIRRFYGKDPFGTDPIDFDTTLPMAPEGHCIAARITAENPHKNFQPTSGKVQELNFRSSRHVWGYFSIDSSGLIHEFADSQLGHVFAWGPNREEARRNLVVALKDMSIRGEIRTTVEYLITLIEQTDYKNNNFHTAWLDERIAKQDVKDNSMQSIIIVLVGAACEAHAKALAREKAFLASLERGQMPPQNLLAQKHTTEIIYDNVKYVLDTARAGVNLYAVSLAGSSENPVIIEVRSLADGGYLVLMGGKSHVAYMKDEVGARRLVIDSQTCLFVDEYDPTTIRAAMGGKIVRALYPDGTALKKDQAFCEIEVMKMTMPLLVPEDGKIYMLKSGGSVMQPGDVIARLELADPTKVKRAEKYTGTLPQLGEPRPELSESNPHHVLANAQERLEDVMTGFAPPRSVRKSALKSLGSTSLNPFLFVLEMRETLARVKRELSYQTQDAILSLCSNFEAELLRLTETDSPVVHGGIVASMSQVNLAELAEETPAPLTRQESTWKRAKSLNDEQLARALKLAQEYAAKAAELLQKENVASPLLHQICARHAHGAYDNALRILESILDMYAAPEATFAELEFSDSAEKDDVMQELRRKYSSDAKKVYDLSLSHSAVATKNEVAVALLGMVEALVRRQEDLSQTAGTQMESVRPRAVKLLKKIASLRGKETTEVALEARQLLIELQQLTYRERMENIIARLKKVSEGDADAIDELQHSTDPILHMLLDVLCTENTAPEIRAAALASYVRRVYQTYKLRDLSLTHAESSVLKSAFASWLFYSEPDSVTFQVGGGLGLLGDLHVPVFGGSEGENLALAQQPKTPSDNASNKDEGAPAPLGAHGRTPSMSSLGGASSIAGLVNRPRAGSDQQDEEMVDAGQLMANAVAPFVVRKASLAVFNNGFNELKKKFNDLLKTVKVEAEQTIKLEDGRELVLKTDVQVLHIILRVVDASAEPNLVDTNPDSMSDKLHKFFLEHDQDLKANGVRRITVAIPSDADQARHHVVAGHGSSFFTFRRRSGWEEDRLVRHIEPSLAYQLDLKRLSNFNIARVPLGKRDLSASRTVHVYRATPKGQSKLGSRLFVRALVRQTSKVDGVAHEADSYPGPERVLVQAIAAIEACQGAGQTDGARNHIFLNVLGDAMVEPYVVERMARHLGRRYASRLASARVGQVELKVNARLDKESPSIPVRIVASNPTGFGLRVDTYVEAADPANPGHSVFYSISEGDDGGASGALAAMGLSTSPTLTPSSTSNTFFAGDLEGEGDLEQHSQQAPELHGLDTQTPYPVSSPLEERRSRALASGTAFCYDFPAIFNKALERSWVSFAAGRRGVDIPSPSTMSTFEELVLADEFDAPGLSKIAGTNLAKTSRGPGSNTIAMVAWRAVVKTPQYPEGRQFILIANDITVDAGSFGTREDELFLEASKLARGLKVPRLYIAANSGARIGMADEVKRCFKVAFIDANNPTLGFRYIYLDQDGYKLLGPDGRNSVICEKIQDEGEERFKITAIVGEGRDLGVENLRGSGLIAGETSRAYDETFTLTYVAGRSVGIGAYLVRLGQRTIQKGKDAPIILTGYQALNTLVGSPVYSSNLQLGGPGIMYANGVSHQCVRNDLEGIAAMLQWLSYIPETRVAALPMTRLLRDDTVERDVTYPLSDGELTNDPRLLLTGLERKVHVNGETTTEWISGLFDRGSFQEYLGGWAKTIITGRARLGGIPVGVIIPECRTVTTRVPADPAAPDSQERVITQAGNVWFPDSSYKTASCIRDVNREGLPLIFIINVRGFSGGQRDMYDAVLKYGSMIVDALVEFKQPVIVYIPKKAELRGGAWVVVDPTINENVMEMWCDETARGGVLEASGAASIKFRVNDQLAAAHRLDPILVDLDGQLSKAKKAGADEATQKAILDKIKTRERYVLPVYSQLATEFADAHDRPGRMVAKGVVNGVVPWSKSRRFFAIRLRRLLREFEVARKIVADRPEVSLKDARKALMDIYQESGEALKHPWTDDAAAQAWMDSPDGVAAVDGHLKAVRAATIAQQVENLGNQDAAAMLRGLMSLIARMSDEGRLAEREKLVSALRRGVFVLSSSTQSAQLNKPM